MANREKGEASFQAGDKTYTLLIDMHAWALTQDALTKGDVVPTLELIDQRLKAGHLLTIAAAFFASLQRYHADEIVSIRKATALLQKSDGKGSDALLAAIKESSGDEADLREMGVKPNPTPAQSEKKTDGTGEQPTSTLVGSV